MINVRNVGEVHCVCAYPSITGLLNTNSATFNALTQLVIVTVILVTGP